LEVITLQLFYITKTEDLHFVITQGLMPSVERKYALEREIKAGVHLFKSKHAAEMAVARRLKGDTLQVEPYSLSLLSVNLPDTVPVVEKDFDEVVCYENIPAKYIVIIDLY
jgi:hypothetical protein